MSVKQHSRLFATIVCVCLGGAAGCTKQSTPAPSSPDANQGADAAEQPTQLEIQLHHDEAFGENAVLVLGEETALLVDGHFSVAAAQSLVQAIEASGRTLQAAFLTHAHPDHYLGLRIVQDSYPGLEVLATPEVVADFEASAPGTLAYLRTAMGDAVPAALPQLTTFEGDTIAIEGQTIRLLRASDVESSHHVSLELPDSETLIASDLVFAGIHLFLSECRGAQWSAALSDIVAASYAHIVPGHGRGTDPSAAQATRDYIEAALPILDQAESAPAAVQALSERFPAYGGQAVLALSTERYLQDCR